MGLKKIIILVILILLFSSHSAYCEYNNQTEEEPESILDDFFALISNHIFEVRDYVHTEECYNYYALSGNGMKVGIWESISNNDSAKVADQRWEFGGRVHVVDHYTNSSSHATAVALIIGSNTGDNDDKGMASSVEMYSYDSTNCFTEMTSSNVDIATHSYGLKNKSRLSEYTYTTQISSEKFDEAIKSNSIICFNSAGNDYDDFSYSSINPPGTAKNTITIGASENDFFNQMAYFSGSGPTDDGRIKPEIVAPGYDLLLGMGQYQHSIQGTSYACPVVSGSSALILEHWNNTHSGEDMLPSTMKALLVHTANNDGHGPTYRYGYGMLDTKEAVDLVQLDLTKNITIIQDNSSFDNFGLQYSN